MTFLAVYTGSKAEKINLDYFLQIKIKMVELEGLKVIEVLL